MVISSLICSSAETALPLQLASFISFLVVIFCDETLHAARLGSYSLGLADRYNEVCVVSRVLLNGSKENTRIIRQVTD